MMPSLNIRGLTEEQVRRIKVNAAAEGRTLREYLLNNLLEMVTGEREGPKAREKRVGLGDVAGPAYSRPQHAENCKCLSCRPPRAE
jgi:plasmid stability protein